MIEDYAHIQDLANRDVQVLIEKGKSYGSSWRNRGGVGAFMMLARKWDRIENQCKAHGYDIFEVIEREMALNIKEGILDDIQDLRRYLLLVESHILAPKKLVPRAPSAPVDPRQPPAYEEELRRVLSNAAPPPPEQPKVYYDGHD